MFIRNNDAEQRIEQYLSDAGLTLKTLWELTEGNNYIIFGGAIRDAFAGEDSCNDIDILTHEKYEPSNKFKLKKVYDDYSNGMKGKCYLRDGFKTHIDLLYPEDVETFFNFVSIIKEVDISASGIGYNHMFGFIECVPDAIIHAQRKIFKLNILAKGYNAGKSDDRMRKLKQRGWLQI